MNSEEYLKERVDDQIFWYDNKSKSNKRGYIILQIITLVASASVPIIAIFTENIWARVIVAILGSVTAVATGVVSLYQFREHWIEYRTTSESLKHEKYQFKTLTGPYENENPFPIFVSRVEALVSQENSNWQQRLKSQKKEKKNS